MVYIVWRRGREEMKRKQKVLRVKSSSLRRLSISPCPNLSLLSLPQSLFSFLCLFSCNNNSSYNNKLFFVDAVVVSAASSCSLVVGGVDEVVG